MIIPRSQHGTVVTGVLALSFTITFCVFFSCAVMLLGVLLEHLVGLPGELLLSSAQLSLSLLICLALLFATMSLIALLILLISLILATVYKVSLEKVSALGEHAQNL